MFHIVLYQPEIPQNTGNIARTCAATGCRLHLIGPLGFSISDSAVKRAGLDYWDKVFVKEYPSYQAFLEENPGGTKYFFTTKGGNRYCDAAFCAGDYLVFGKETKGLPLELLEENAERALRLPMLPNLRSLNLSNTVAAVVYEGLRQNDFPGFV